MFAPGVVLASTIACRRLPAPELPILVTVKVASSRRSSRADTAGRKPRRPVFVPRPGSPGATRLSNIPRKAEPIPRDRAYL